MEDEAVNLVVEVDDVQNVKWTDEIIGCTRLAQSEGRDGLRVQKRVEWGRCARSTPFCAVVEERSSIRHEQTD